MGSIGATKSITRTLIKIKNSSVILNEKEKRKVDNNVNSDLPFVIVSQDPLNKEADCHSSTPEILINKHKIQQYSDIDHVLSFLVTIFQRGNYQNTNPHGNNIDTDTEYYHSNASYIYKLTSFSVEITNSLGKKNTIYFNIKQMRVLSYLSKFGKIETLIKKLVINDNDHNPYIDMSFFDKVENKNFTFLDHIFYTAKHMERKDEDINNHVHILNAQSFKVELKYIIYFITDVAGRKCPEQLSIFI
jgi:hypothetical protein